MIRSGVGKTSRTRAADAQGVYRAVLNALLNDGNTVADYRADTGVTGTLAVSSWANQIGSAPALAQGTGANQPIYLPFSGQQYIYLPAVAGNTVTSPNKSVTGSQSISFNVALNDYTPAADVTLFSKLSGNNGFAVYWLTTDKVRLAIGDGASVTNVDCVASSSFTDGTQHTVRIDWADGVGATFFLDGVQSGSQVAAAKTLTNAATAITVVSTTSIGKLYSLTIGSVYSCDPNLAAETTTNGATWTASTGEVWTLNCTGSKPAQIVGSSQFLFDGSAHYMKTQPFTLNQPETVYLVGKQITWTGNDTIFTGDAGNNMRLSQKNGGTSPQIGLGASALAVNSDWTLNTSAVVAGVFNGASSLIQVNNGTATTADAGALNAGGFILGAFDSTPQVPANFQVKEVIIRSAADSAATRALIYQYLRSIHGTA